jgi:hypothetical protein
MIELCVALVLVAGALWLAFALVGFVFKVFFALLGGLFGLMVGAVGLLVGGAVLLAMAPIVALALLPFCLPVLLLVGLVWAIARSARRAPPAAQPTH